MFYFESTQYSIELKFFEPKYETISQIELVEIYSIINRPYPFFKLVLYIPPRIYRDIIRFHYKPIFLNIKQIMEKESSATSSHFKEFKFQLQILSYDYIFPHRDEHESGGDDYQNKLTKVSLLCVPNKAFLFANELIKADIYKNKKLEDILKKVCDDKIEIDPQFDNQRQFEEIFIPTMPRQHVINFLNYYYGYYKGQYIAYLGFDDEGGQVLDYEKIKFYISKINQLKKEGTEILKIHYTNNMSGRNNVPTDSNQRTSRNNYYLVIGNTPILINTITNTIIDGFKQRHVFKPLDLLHDTRYIDFSKKDETETNIDKNKAYMLSKQDREIEEYKLMADVYKDGYKNYIERTKYNFLDEDLFNECILSYNDSIMNNDNVSLYVPLTKGVLINHFLNPGRTINVTSEPENIQITGNYFLHTSTIKLFKNGRSFYEALAELKLSRANINQDDSK